MAKPKKPSSSKKVRQFAEDYGYAVSFLKSDPELWKLFNKAIDEGWDGDLFAKKLPATKWYKKHADTYRQQLALSKIDPATYKQNVGQKRAEIADLARAMGSVAKGSSLDQIAEHAIQFGWSDAQIRNVLADQIKQVNGQYIGQAGQDAATLRQTAWKNGVKINEGTMADWERKIASGERTAENYQQWLRSQAKTLAPGYAKELDSGLDLYDIASPFMQSMSTTLELNPSDIDLFDPTIRKAMSGQRDDKGNVTQPTLYDFENGLRQDKRWLKTKTAQDTFSSTANKVLSDWGLV